MAFGVLELGVTLVYLIDRNLTDRPIPNYCGHDTGRGLCALNSRSDDHSNVARIQMLSRVVSRLNSEFYIPLFVGFDSGK